jgi:hypothetical protein
MDEDSSADLKWQASRLGHRGPDGDSNPGAALLSGRSNRYPRLICFKKLVGASSSNSCETTEQLMVGTVVFLKGDYWLERLT